MVFKVNHMVQGQPYASRSTIWFKVNHGIKSPCSTPVQGCTLPFFNRTMHHNVYSQILSYLLLLKYSPAKNVSKSALSISIISIYTVAVFVPFVD